MKYLLRKVILGKVPEIEITAEEYTEFEKAKNILTNALAIEEKYEIVIRNYLEFEKQMLDTTITDMVRTTLGYPDFFEVHLGLNIRLINLLAAARMYVDQLNQNVRECIPNIDNIKELVKKFFSKEHDDNKDYRFMEALRNYVQHRGIPVHSAPQGGRWTSLEDDGLLEYYMELYTIRSYLEVDSKFKKTSLDELDEKIDLKLATRSYMESLSNVHESVRSIITESVKAARELIENAHRRYADIHKGSLAGLSACKCSNKKLVCSVPLLLDWDDVRIELQMRNRKLINLRKRYVTSSIKINNKKSNKSSSKQKEAPKRKKEKAGCGCR